MGVRFSAKVAAMSSGVLALCLLLTCVERGVPKPSGIEGLVAARAVLSSLETTPLRDVALEDRVFRVGVGSFNGQAALANGTLRSIGSVRIVNLAPADDFQSGSPVIQADLPLSQLAIHYNANVSFGARSERAELDIAVESLELVVELIHEGKGRLELQTVEARDMKDMNVTFSGLRVFQAQGDLLSLLFRGAFRFDIEDELVALFDNIIRELVDSYNINNL